MKYIPHFIIIAVVALLFFFGSRSYETEAMEATETETLATQMTQGDQLYVENCQTCHGEDQRGTSVFPNLRMFQKDENAFREALTGGYYPMPSFEGVLSEDQQHTLWVFISANSDLD